MEGVEENALGGGGVGFPAVLRPQVIGDHRVGANGKADGDGVDQVLYRKHQGQGRHGILADFGHIIAVDNVVQRRDHHGQDHGQGHGQNQRQNGPGLHKGLLHGGHPLLFEM